MKSLEIGQQLIDSIGSCLQENGISLPPGKLRQVVAQIKDEILGWYTDGLIHQVESILEIDPLLEEKEILQTLARNIVEFLQADYASIRIYDPGRNDPGSFPHFSPPPEDFLEPVPFEKAIADEVLRTRRSYQVPIILHEPKYQNKGKARERGIHSLLAVPISIP